MPIPAVPPLPDLPRLTTYTAVAAFGPLAVGFDLYGDGEDYENWLRVFLNGIEMTTGFTVSSATGPFDEIPRPITDAVIEFDPAITGQLIIVGARRPRRTSQLSQAQGVPARVFNQIISDLTAQLREIWDERLRTVRAPPGETMEILTPAAGRANHAAGFDSAGNLTASSQLQGVTVSTAMIPVVTASSIAAAKILLGISAAMSPVLAAATIHAAFDLLVGTTRRADGKGLFYDSASGGYVHAYASPKDPVGDLRDFMDLQYGVGGWTNRTTAHTGTDALPAINAGLLAIRNRYGYGSLRIVNPNGATYRVSGGINPLYLKGMMIEGVCGASNISQLTFDMNDGICFNFDSGAGDGARGYTGGGLRNIQLYLDDGYPTSTVTLIQLQGDSLTQPHSMIFENVSTAAFGSSFFYNGMFVNGNDLPNLGIRAARMSAVYMFSCRNLAYYFSNIRFWKIDQLNSSNGSGTGNDGYITGGGTAATNSTSCQFSRTYLNGDLHWNNCADIEFTGRASSIITNSTAEYCYGTVAESSLSGTFGANSNVIIL